MPIALNEAVRLLVVNRGRRDDAPLASRCQNKRKKVKILGFILGCSSSHQLMKLDVCQSRWVSLYPIPIVFQLRKTIRKEKFIPKVSIPTPVPRVCPAGARTMAGLFKWPEVFLTMLVYKFGAGLVRDRVNAWNWDVSTAFSGVGCPENVPQNELMITRVLSIDPQ